MQRLTLIFLLSSEISFFLLWKTEGEISNSLNNINTFIFCVCALFGALSIGFFNYIEGIIKDIPKSFKAKKPNKYKAVVGALTGLKREIISNIILVVILIITSLTAEVAGNGALASHFHNTPWQWIIPSIRYACFLTILVAFFIQAIGFITANDLRSELSTSND